MEILIAINDSEKIGIIFSKVARIETDVALIKERDLNSEKRMNTYDGKIQAIEDAVVAYKIERAKIIGMAVASGAIFGAIGSFVIWLVGSIKN